MRVMAQMAMVMNLDKCIGCHTCSVTCKQAWTNRAGTEYVWFNNVETRPGQGYPRRYEDQETWKGGWTLNRRGNLTLKGGGRWHKLLHIFSNPKLPSIQDYYEPWTYDYSTLTDAPAQQHTPVARPKSLISGNDMKITWSANWDDDLGGSIDHGHKDVLLANIADKVKFEFEQTFMFYLPRICEHCLNPSCAASCPSGAIYKRSEDGIVLVDQDRCRGWRMCVSGCPYKKVYFNHRTGKAEKCTFCFPRVEVGLPTVCSETCVGRLRYIGLVLYDADRVLEAASTDGRPGPLRGPAQRPPRPARPRRGARGRARRHPAGLGAGGAALTGLGAHQQVPGRPAAAPGVPHHADGLVHPAAVAGRRHRPRHRVTTPRTGATCSPPSTRCASRSSTSPSCSPPATPHAWTPSCAGSRRCARYMREITMGRPADESIAAAVGMTGVEVQDMYRLLAIAKYEERYVIPPAHAEQAHSLEELATECSLDYEGGPGMGGSGPFGEGSGVPTPIAVENFQMLQDRQTSDTVPEVASRRGRVNLLGWDGRGHPDGLFPPPVDGAGGPGAGEPPSGETGERS